MPVDPLSQGLGAALSAYQALKPPMQYQQPQYDPSTIKINLLRLVLTILI
jgi:hypothetical protein